MLSRITGVLGPFPPKVLAAGRDTFKYFTLANVLYEKVGDPPVLDKHICTFKYFFTLANVLYEKVGSRPPCPRQTYMYLQVLLHPRQCAL